MRATHQSQGSVNFTAQDVKCSRRAGFSCGAKSVERRPTYHDGGRAQANGLEYVVAASVAAIDEQGEIGEPVPRGCQYLERGDRIIKLATAVVGNDDRIGHIRRSVPSVAGS